MNETIYNSNAEQGLLRALGPHSIYSSSKTISGLLIVPQWVVGENRIFGHTNIVETKPKDTMGSEKFEQQNTFALLIGERHF